VYVRKQIVHNRHVVEELAEAGAVFVDSLDEVPNDAVVVFSAHGVAPDVREAAGRGVVAVFTREAGCSGLRHFAPRRDPRSPSTDAWARLRRRSAPG
jgi:4-hydroxy-3-methylbut-2-enyl diphosphate reductase IspH